uniref:Xylanase inhibitor C-terminal domain-containing protein n=1 Tax=Solanum lycopersicum TaxID=4081 RepID=A0A3Q7EHS4_SOLLC
LSHSGACNGNCTGSSPGHPNKDCTCSHLSYNPVSRTSTGTGLNEDVITIQDTEGLKPGPYLKPDLGSSTNSPGVIFIGEGPYVLLPNIDVSKNLFYTPLLTNPISTAGSSFGGEPSTDYFIGVKTIKVNGDLIPINNLLLEINEENGEGGTKISTIDPYTKLESSIYKAFVHSLTIPRVKKVAPFEMCYKSSSLPSTRVGPGVPNIEFVLQGKNGETPSFIISGANSMVAVTDEVLCLGFVNGGENPTTSIVIGGHQIEDNLVQIDIDNKRVGFSNSLLYQQTTCANFNFGSTQGREIV